MALKKVWHTLCTLTHSDSLPTPFFSSFFSFLLAPFILSYFHSILISYNFLLTETFPSRRKGNTHETEEVNPLHLFWKAETWKTPEDSLLLVIEALSCCRKRF